jgi:8-oxo-dGTP diphosphatase
MSYLQVGPQQRVKRLNISFDHEVTGAVLIDMRGRFLFQRRDDVPGILSPGKIGLFGGHRKTGET